MCSGAADEYLKSFMAEMEVLNNNITNNASPQTTMKKKRRRTLKAAVKPGWVPKPPDDCPIITWLENGKYFAVQNPSNSGVVLLKMEIFDGMDMVYKCGLFLDKNSEIYENVNQIVNGLENMWIDKSTGVPKVNGLTQTITPQSGNIDGDTSTPAKKRAAAPRRRGRTIKNK